MTDYSLSVLWTKISGDITKAVSDKIKVKQSDITFKEDYIQFRALVSNFKIKIEKL